MPPANTRHARELADGRWQLPVPTTPTARAAGGPVSEPNRARASWHCRQRAPEP